AAASPLRPGARTAPGPPGHRPGSLARARGGGVTTPGTATLASAPSRPGKKQPLTQTGGEGGYAIAPGSPPACHETGRPYEHVSGPPLAEVPTITAEEREVLIRCARSFDRQAAHAPGKTPAAAGDRPGDCYNRAGPDWAEILEPHGWVCVRSAGDNARPEIVITTEEHEVNDQAVSALAREPGLYQRGGMLVRVVRDASPACKGVRRPFAPRIDPLPPPLLRERLAANARWVEVRETKQGVVERPARPPAWCVAAVHARADCPPPRHPQAPAHYPPPRP